MIKADFLLSNGTQVKVEGPSADITAILEYFSNKGSSPPASPREKVTVQDAKDRRSGPQKVIEHLASEKYFGQKRKIANIHAKLAELGHFYSASTIGVCLLRLTKKRVLRRLKEEGEWNYVC